MNAPKQLAPFLAFLAACPSCPPVNVDKVGQCKMLYDQCVEKSANRDEYDDCRAAVDERCLDDAAPAASVSP